MKTRSIFIFNTTYQHWSIVKRNIRQQEKEAAVRVAEADSAKSKKQAILAQKECHEISFKDAGLVARLNSDKNRNFKFDKNDSGSFPVKSSQKPERFRERSNSKNLKTEKNSKSETLSKYPNSSQKPVNPDVVQYGSTYKIKNQEHNNVVGMCKICNYNITQHHFTIPDEFNNNQPLKCSSCCSYFHEECHYPPFDGLNELFDVSSWQCSACQKSKHSDEEDGSSTGRRFTRKKEQKTLKPGCDQKSVVENLNTFIASVKHKLTKTENVGLSSLHNFVNTTKQASSTNSSRPVSPNVNDSRPPIFKNSFFNQPNLTPTNIFSKHSTRLSKKRKKTFNYSSELHENIVKQARKNEAKQVYNQFYKNSISDSSDSESVSSAEFTKLPDSEWSRALKTHESIKKCKMSEAEQKANQSLFRCVVCAEKPLTVNLLNSTNKNGKILELSDDMLMHSGFYPFVSCCVCFESYHLKCTNPPLTSLPQNASWKCPKHDYMANLERSQNDKNEIDFKRIIVGEKYFENSPMQAETPDYETEVAKFLARNKKSLSIPIKTEIVPENQSALLKNQFQSPKTHSSPSFSVMEDALNLFEFSCGSHLQAIEECTTIKSEIPKNSSFRKRVTSESGLKPIFKTTKTNLKLQKVTSSGLQRPKNLSFGANSPPPISPYSSIYLRKANSYQEVNKLAEQLDKDSLIAIATQFLYKQCNNDKNTDRMLEDVRNGVVFPGASRKLSFQASQCNLDERNGCVFQPIKPAVVNESIFSTKIASPNPGLFSQKRFSPGPGFSPAYQPSNISSKPVKNISESVTCVFQVPNSNRKILISLKPGETKLIGKDTQNTQKSQIPIDISSLIHNFNRTTGTKKQEQTQDQTHNNPHASGSDTCTPCRYYQPEHLMLYCNHNRQIELLAIGEFWLNGQRYFSKKRSRKNLKNYYKRYDKLTSNFVVAYEDNYRKNIEKAAQTVNEFNKLKSVRNGVAEAEFQQFCRCDELESASQFDGNNYLQIVGDFLFRRVSC